MPESGINLYIIKRQRPDGDGATLIVTHGGKTSVGGQHSDNVALADASVNMVYGPGEYPRVEAQQAFLLASFQIYLSIVHVNA